MGGFTGEFLRAAHVDEGEAGVHVGEGVGEEGADFRVLTFWRHRVRGGGGMGDIAGQRMAIGDPFGTAAVQHLGVLVAEELENPESVTRPPV